MNPVAPCFNTPALGELYPINIDIANIHECIPAVWDVLLISSIIHIVDIENIAPVWDVLKRVRGIRLDLHRSETLRKGKLIKSQLSGNDPPCLKVCCSRGEYEDCAANLG